MPFLRILVIILLIWGAFKVLKLIGQHFSKTRQCLKCDGFGYWEGLRGKETCDECKGSGVVLKKRLK